MKPVVAATLFAACVFASAANARLQDGAADPGQGKAAALLQNLHYQTGEVALANAGAHLHVQPGFRYLGHDDTRKVLEDLWGNPPDDGVLGLLVPDNAPLDSEHSWAVLVTYSDDGHVSDEDAGKIDYKLKMRRAFAVLKAAVVATSSPRSRANSSTMCGRYIGSLRRWPGAGLTVRGSR